MGAGRASRPDRVKSIATKAVSYNSLLAGKGDSGQGASRPMPVKSSSPPTRVALRPCGGPDRPLARQTGCLGHRPAKAAPGRHSAVVTTGGMPPDPVRQTCRPAMLKATETSRPPWPPDCPAKGTCPLGKLAAGFAQPRRCGGARTARGDRGRPGTFQSVDKQLIRGQSSPGPEVLDQRAGGAGDVDRHHGPPRPVAALALDAGERGRPVVFRLARAFRHRVTIT